MKNLFAKYNVIIFALLLCTCGLEDVDYLEPVAEASVVRTGNYHVDMNDLPPGRGATGHGSISRVSLDFTSSQVPNITSTNLSLFLENFDIYYRIYLSPVMLTSTINESLLTQINPTLYSDYTALKPYTVTTNNYASSVGSAFSGRSYWEIDRRSNPNILRSAQLITPYPSNRFFFNDPDIKNYLDPQHNADVVDNTGGTQYAYVSMYVVHTAFSDSTLAPYYSSPTWLGTLLMPDTVVVINVDFIAQASPATGSTTAIIITLVGSITSIPGLDADDIIITDDASWAAPSPPNTSILTKGTLTGSGPTYTLPISGIPAGGGTISININKQAAGNYYTGTSAAQVLVTP